MKGKCLRCGCDLKEGDKLWYHSEGSEHFSERTCILSLQERLATAEAAARWCYRILVDNQDLSHFYATDQWPWLADEAAKGGRDA